MFSLCEKFGSYQINGEHFNAVISPMRYFFIMIKLTFVRRSVSSCFFLCFFFSCRFFLDQFQAYILWFGTSSARIPEITEKPATIALQAQCLFSHRIFPSDLFCLRRFLPLTLILLLLSTTV